MFAEQIQLVIRLWDTAARDQAHGDCSFDHKTVEQAADAKTCASRPLHELQTLVADGANRALHRAAIASVSQSGFDAREWRNIVPELTAAQEETETRVRSWSKARLCEELAKQHAWRKGRRADTWGGWVGALALDSSDLRGVRPEHVRAVFPGLPELAAQALSTLASAAFEYLVAQSTTAPLRSLIFVVRIARRNFWKALSARERARVRPRSECSPFRMRWRLLPSSPTAKCPTGSAKSCTSCSCTLDR
jgi:hypothetical protein